MLNKRRVSLAVSVLLVLAVLTVSGRTAEPQKQTGEPFIKIREVIWGDPHPTRDLWVSYFTDTIYQKYAVGNWDIDRLRTYGI